MSYSTALLKTAADCDAVLLSAGREKADIELKKLVLASSLQNLSEDSQDLEADLAELTGDIATLQSVIATLPDGKRKTENQDKLTTAQYKLYLLNKRRNKKGFQLQLDRELDLANAAASLDNVNALIAEVTAKKATL